MRILVTTPYFYPVVGGSQNYILGLYAALRTLDPTIKVDVLTYNTEDSAAVEELQGLTIYRVPAIEVLPKQFAFPNLWVLFSLIKKLRQTQHYDWVNAHTRFFDTAWWTPMVANYLGANTVLTDHVASHPAHPNAVVRAVARVVDSVALSIVPKLYTKLTVVSTATKTFLQRYTTKAITVIPGAVDTAVFNKQQPLPDQLAFLQTLPKDTVVITFAGRLIQEKGVLQFMQAAQKLTKTTKNIEFVIVGEGALHSAVAATASTQKHMHVITGLQQTDVAALLQRTSIFVHPSTHSEGLPLVILEAGAAGCAVVATPVGEVATLLADDRGIFCQATAESITDSIATLLAQPQQRKTMAKKLHDYVLKNHTFTRSAKKFLQLLQK